MPRPKIPTALKLLRGNPGHHPINPDEFRPAARIPSCPVHLTGEARKEWRRLSLVLVQYGMCSDVDRGALAQLCTAWGRYVQAEEMIKKAAEASPASYGMFQKTPNDFIVQAPWLAVSNRSIEIYCRLMVEFGLTPASRSGLVPSRPAQPLLKVVDEGFSSL